jgi:hypothetical protein
MYRDPRYLLPPAKHAVGKNAEAVQGEDAGNAQYAQAIFDRALKIDGTGLVEVQGWTGNFRYAEFAGNDLSQHFVVENKVV